jgi:hypothetical protein
MITTFTCMIIEDILPALNALEYQIMKSQH